MPRPILILGALLPLVIAAAGFARWIKSAADDTYVRADSLALWRQRDSLNLKATVDAMQKDVSSLVRACQHKGECP